MGKQLLAFLVNVFFITYVTVSAKILHVSIFYIIPDK